MKLSDKIRLVTLVMLLGSATAVLANDEDAAPEISDETSAPANTAVTPDATVEADEPADTAAEGEESTNAAAEPVAQDADFVAVKAEGLAKAENKDYDGAVTVFQDYLKAHPTSASAMVYLGFVYLNQQKFQEAITISEQAIKLDESNYQGYLNIGMANIGLKNMDKAKENIMKSYDLAKASNSVLGQALSAYNMSILLGVSGNFADAVTWSETAISVIPADVAQGKAVPADLNLDEFDQALLVKAYKGAVMAQAKSYHGLKDDKKAFDIVDNFLKVYPDDEEAKGIVEALKEPTK